MQGLVKFTTHKPFLQELLEDVFQQIEKRNGVNTFIKTHCTDEEAQIQRGKVICQFHIAGK